MTTTLTPPPRTGDGIDAALPDNRKTTSSPPVVRVLLVGLAIVAIAFGAAFTLGGSSPITGTAMANQAAVAAYTVPDLRAAALRYFAAKGVDGDAESVTLVFSEYSTAGTMESLGSYLSDLGFSGATYDRMMSTRALDGTQRADGHNCDVTWTYHPDDGLRTIFETKPVK